MNLLLFLVTANLSALKFTFVMGLLKETGYLKETTIMKIAKEELNQAACTAHHLGIRDTMDMLSGKWKIRIIGSLNFGEKRFMELKGNIEGIAAKMLSKELQELELNGLVKRTVLNTKPITVEYELTSYGHSLKPLIDMIAAWGMQHRQQIIKKIKVNNLP